MILYDPPSGWKYGFPKPYSPERICRFKQGCSNLGGPCASCETEPLAQTLLRDGYPQHEIDNGGAAHCRFLGSEEELDKLTKTC